MILLIEPVALAGAIRWVERKQSMMLDTGRGAELVTARRVAVGAALVAAVLYGLIGLGVLAIGRPADGSAGDLLGFGVSLGGTFAVVAVLILRAHSRAILASIAVLQLVVIFGYFAFSSLRESPVETWGLVIKISQAVLLVAVGYLVVRREPRRAEVRR